LLLSGAPSVGLAQSAQVAFGNSQQDSSLPVEVVSEVLNVNENDRTAIFTGNVVVGQGEMRLWAPRVEVIYKPDQSGIESLHATDKDIDLMDDKYVQQAQKWAEEGKEPSKSERRKLIKDGEVKDDKADKADKDDAEAGGRVRRDFSKAVDDVTFTGLLRQVGSAIGMGSTWLVDRDGDGRVGGFAGAIGTAISMAGSIAMNLLDKVLDGNVQNGREVNSWLWAIGGFIGANFLLGRMDAFKGKNGLIKLVLAGSAAAMAAKFGFGQGSGKHTPDTLRTYRGPTEKRTQPTSTTAAQNAAAASTQKPASNVIPLISHDGTTQIAAKELIAVEDETTPGVFGIQVNAGGKSYAPKDFEQFGDNIAYLPSAIAQAKQSGTYIETDQLPDQVDEAKEWSFDAIDHEGNNIIVLQNKDAAAANDAQYIVLDVAGP